MELLFFSLLNVILLQFNRRNDKMSQEIYRKDVLPLRKQLFHIARNMLGSEQDAEDAVQEVLLKLWRLAHTLQKYENPSAMAIKAVKNHCLDRIKLSKKNQSLSDVADVYVLQDNPHLQLERKNTEEILMKIIENLPPLQQMIITMKDLEHHEVEEIAEITGTNAEAVRVNLSRARKKVREEFLKYNTL